MGTHRAAFRSGAYYPSFFLKLYQHYVLGYTLPVVWACDPETTLVPYFTEGFTANHLDCGVADGYFPCRSVELLGTADGGSHLTFLDLNPSSLEAARRRLLSLAPGMDVRCIKADIRAPLPAELAGSSFTSISMFNLFHCVPGGAEKWRSISTYKEVLSADGVVTGCTILGKSYITSRLARLTMRFYNLLGPFSNWDDSREDVEEVLNQEFSEVETKLVGMVLLFRARKPKRH
ncbi:methyltransferase [Nemania abortiva]|nr:methyltransferase [Nemania abortiva]